jgi:cation diffusion facilitator family transporter
MPIHDLTAWTHDHQFNTVNADNEKNSRRVLWLTLVMMVLEIAAGYAFNSMALLADGWHMSSHALAIGMGALAYVAARRYADNPRFAFGTWKIEILASFASALCLLGVALLMLVQSLERLWTPQTIDYREALVVAVIGMLVNLLSAWLLAGSGHHHHDHHHDHSHCGHGHEAHPHHHGEDLNLKAIYLHVLADAATSVFAILALLGGMFYGWRWLDPLMGIVGAVLISVWAKGLLGESGKILLDSEMDAPVVEEIREVIAALAPDTGLADLHVWRVGRGSYACALTVITHDRALKPQQVRAALAIHEEIVHATIEVQVCEQCPVPDVGQAGGRDK